MRGILQRVGEKTGNFALFNGFTRGRYRVKTTRTNQVSVNPQWRDTIVLVSHTEVRELFLAWPRIAKVGVHGLPAKRIGGRLPRVRFTVKGNPLIDRLALVGDTYVWRDPDEANQSNCVWASCDLYTAEFAGGRLFDREVHIDKPSAYVAAAYADRLITLRDATTEKASRLSTVIETRESLLAKCGDMCRPAGIVPYLKGDVLAFGVEGKVDDLTDEDEVPRYSTARRTA
jgi:hypothetical protein